MKPSMKSKKRVYWALVNDQGEFYEIAWSRSGAVNLKYFHYDGIIVKVIPVHITPVKGKRK